MRRSAPGTLSKPRRLGALGTRESRRRLSRTAFAVAVLLLGAACGGGGGNEQTSGSSIDWNQKPPSRPVEVTFWHGFSAGANQDALNHLVAAFNQQHQGQIHVTPTYTGQYDDTFAKLKTGLQSNQPNQLPSVVQIYDIGTRFMIDSKAITPMQTFIDHDKYNVSDLWANIRGYYQVQGKLYSMPWNTSMPLLYYNKDAFKAAGLDPNKPPQTLDEIRSDAVQLKAHGQPGFGAAIYGWFLEQWTARANQLYCNNGNGRDGLATRTLIDQPVDVNVMQWWTQMVKDGLALQLGRQTTDAQKAFEAGRVSMTVESTGVLRQFQQAASFQVGAGPYPRSESSTAGGPIIGGASLWIMGKKPSYEQVAAWQFVKFLMEPENQAYFHTHTGYFPPNKKALDEPDDRRWVAQYPQFETAVAQLQQTPVDTATQGCALGVMPQARQAAEDAMEKALTGRESPKDALADGVKAIQPAIDSYNQSVSG
jgi:sn-glycerol 3-phosphate transport system substrate-binding protein